MSTEKNILLNRLKKGAQAHKQNTLFTTLLTMIEGSDDIIQNNVKLLSAIIDAKGKAKNQENLPDEIHAHSENGSPQLQDMLCLHLMMAGVRAFPSSDEQIKRYGIDLSADLADKDSLKDTAISSIILGGNGMGKLPFS